MSSQRGDAGGFHAGGPAANDEDVFRLGGWYYPGFRLSAQGGVDRTAYACQCGDAEVVTAAVADNAGGYIILPAGGRFYRQVRVGQQGFADGDKVSPARSQDFFSGLGRYPAHADNGHAHGVFHSFDHLHDYSGGKFRGGQIVGCRRPETGDVYGVNSGRLGLTGGILCLFRRGAVFHPIFPPVYTAPDGHVVAYRLFNRINYLEEKSLAVGQTAPIVVPAPVRSWGEELVDEIAVRPVDFDAVKSGLSRPDGGAGERSYRDAYLRKGNLTGYFAAGDG